MSDEQPQPPVDPAAPAAGSDGGVPSSGEEQTVRIQRQSREGRENTERLATRLFDQWSRLRQERQEQLAPPMRVAPVEGRRPSIPYGVDLMAQWGWRFLIIVAAAAVILFAIAKLEHIVVPVVIALLISALMAPVVGALRRLGLSRGVASLISLVLVVAVIAAMMFFAVNQVANGASDLANQASEGLGQIRDWLQTGPLHLSNDQVTKWVNQAQTGLEHWGENAAKNPMGKLSAVGGVALDVLEGLFIALFSIFFFLAEGDLIWAWVVKLGPKTARPLIDSSGRVAWISLTQFIRATVIVAAVDAIGVMIVASILRVPFVAAIGVLVFLGAFIPMIGATIAGTVAVLVALVDHGFVTALIMLGGVILVQQLEAHGLQPFLMGRWVRVHPLAIILSIAVGVLLAGIPGALVAVPLAAVVNAVGSHLAAESAAEEIAGLEPPEPGDD